ncbi:hypothetical protein [Microbulbifer spongiae]|uniref:Morphogenetic protein n=1 Tax=Microbulbifer spongiae TaxID=2944933 RepID=A0ABY9EA01_9GAMM|nr:hypothetical protein [Microbulbifer sp. MI-G]WKD48244.1 hypothetical protein M8T91_09855 [Microbulbifer sp. MI-G]
MSEIVKERPILFNGPMVRAILEGRKTQTRRIIGSKKKPVDIFIQDTQFIDGKEQSLGFEDENGGWFDTEEMCPYGHKGDRLWVRETHHLSHHNALTYRADYNHNPFDEEECGEDCSMVGEKWRPSIHMPRWASRIDLEITNIRVERLREVSPEDAYCEGVTREMRNGFGYACDESEEIFNMHQSKETFRFLWESIHGEGSWDANPWVWVIEFKRVESTQ